MKQPYEQGKRMNLLHGLYDEQMGQQVTGVYSYAEIGRMIGRSISAVKLADDEERLIAGRYRTIAEKIREVVPLDKRILEQYIDACAQVKETEAELEKIRRAKKRQEQDAVKGSSHDFPYTMQTYRIEGLAYASMQEPGAEDRLEEVLKERLRNAARIKQDVEVWINTIPVRMQRIIRYRIFEGMTWEQVAIRMGRGATGDSVRVEYVRFMNVG